MSIIVCPGIHAPELTESFLQALRSQGSHSNSWNQQQNLLVFPAQEYPAYSSIHVLNFINRHLSAQTADRSALTFISFSAGVVGAISAAWAWQLSGGTVKAFIALDGWGVPLYGSFPIHRLSHDYFTHWSSALLGGDQEDSFYADPPVAHLELWRSPQTSSGWWVIKTRHSEAGSTKVATSAASYLTALLQRYQEIL